MNPDKNGQPDTKSPLKTRNWEHLEGVIDDILNNKTDQPPQNAQVVRLSLGKNVAVRSFVANAKAIATKKGGLLRIHIHN